MTKRNGTLEVHEHWYVGESTGKHIAHSHDGGDAPHRHQHCGPASYTIDKDEWQRATGAKGGGRKTYAAQPTGEQLPTIPVAAEDNTFRVIFVDEYSDGHRAAGITPDDFAAMRADFANVAAAAYEYANTPHAVARMVQSFGMTPIYEFATPGDGDGGAR